MKKIIALLLCVILVLGCLAGCTPKTTTETKEEPKKEETKKEEPKKEEPKKEEPKKEETKQEDASKEEEPYLPLVKNGEKVTLTIGIPQSTNVEDYNTNEYTLWLEEQTGIDLEFTYFSTSSSEAATQFSLMVSSGEKLPDILWGFSGFTTAAIYEYGESGYFVDMAPYFETIAPYFTLACDKLDDLDAGRAEGVKQILIRDTDPVNGAIYAFPFVQGVDDNDLPKTHVAINKAWLDKLGEEMPKTTDDLYRVLTRFKNEDPNGNGLEDEIPLAGSYSMGSADTITWLVNAFVYFNDSDFFNVTDGKLWAPVTSDEYRAAMIYLNKLYSEGLISPLFYSVNKYAELKALFTPTDGTAITGLMGAHETTCTETGNEVVFEYEPIGVLADATGSDRGGYALLNTPSFGGLAFTYRYQNFITTDCADPELAFKLLDFMCSEESAIFQRYGVQGRDWKYAEAGEKDIINRDAYIEVLDSTVFSTQNNVNWKVLNSTIFDYSQITQKFTDDGSYASRLEQMKYRYKNANTAVRQVPSSANGILFSAEEQVAINEISSNIKSYVKEARAMFVSGVLDPNNDADWQTYLDALKSMGMDSYIYIAQTAYTRTFG